MKVDQLPPWLTAAVVAAGMTAYADDLDRKAAIPVSPSAEPISPDESAPPLH
jgi:hypothetical protein